MKKLVLNILIATAFLSGCSINDPQESNGKLRVLATTGMIADAVKSIAGDHVEVTTLMGPGVDPHLYKASHGDVNRITSADIVLYNGLHLEGKMEGTDLPLMEDVAETSRAPVIASGGVTTMADLRALEDRGIHAAVIGMALYTGAMDPRVVAEEFTE